MIKLKGVTIKNKRKQSKESQENEDQ